MHRQRYFQCGGENERFIGWSPEDAGTDAPCKDTRTQGGMDSEWATLSPVSSPWCEFQLPVERRCRPVETGTGENLQYG